MASDVNIIADLGCEVGEGVLWHPNRQEVYWTDIPAGHLYRYDPESDNYEQFYDNGTVGGFTFQDDDSLLLFMEEGSVKIWRDGETETIIDQLPDEEGMRYNDVIADPKGRVFCGTMDPDDFSIGRLYRLDTDGTISKLLDPVELPNGMGFTPSKEGLYFTESGTNTIHLFDYDENTGRLSNQRPFAQLPDEEGMYDGMTVDAEGQVWSALWGGGAIVRHTPDGEIEQHISIPAENITSLSFGGDELQDLYITSATFEADPNDTHAGALFQVRSTVSGTVEFTSSVHP